MIFYAFIPLYLAIHKNKNIQGSQLDTINIIKLLENL